MWKQEFFKIFALLLSVQSYQWPVVTKQEEAKPTDETVRSCCVKTCCS